MTDAEGRFWLADRIQKVQSVVEQYGEDQFYIAFSGGRDSTVLHYLIDEALPGNDIPRVYVNTGIEYNEMVKFVKRLAEKDGRVRIVNAGVNIKKMLETDGYPFKSKEHSLYVSVYQRSGETKSVRKYLGKTAFGCPDKLRYQFTSGNRLKISRKCCDRLKKEPFAKAMQSDWIILGIMRDEGGIRKRANCITFYKDRANSFAPLVPMTKDWENWYIAERGIELCPLYYPPYNFERTGCKGCPFNIHLQQALDVLAEYFPGERKQCELIWKPVYDEYRRLGYRLRKDDGQTSLFEFD